MLLAFALTNKVFCMSLTYFYAGLQALSISITVVVLYLSKVGRFGEEERFTGETNPIAQVEMVI